MTQIREVYVVDSIEKFDMGELRVFSIKRLKLEHDTFWPTKIIISRNKPGDRSADLVKMFHVVDYLRGPINHNWFLLEAFEFFIPNSLPKVLNQRNRSLTTIWL